MIKPHEVFLSAEWRYLAMLNYEIDPGALAPYVPAGTELDGWAGRMYVSMVGFLFIRTRVRGVPIPFHRDFEEINLRFYVRRRADDGWRRAVVFLREFVPRRAIAWTANVVYGENYLAVPMAHRIESGPAGLPTRVEYSWRCGRRENWFGMTVEGPASEPAAGSREEFITEHYWGYARQRDGRTLEYEVEHPRWSVWAAAGVLTDWDLTGAYGAPFAEILKRRPDSAFLADGSPVKVSRGRRVMP